VAACRGVEAPDGPDGELCGQPVAAAAAAADPADEEDGPIAESPSLSCGAVPERGRVDEDVSSAAEADEEDEEEEEAEEARLKLLARMLPSLKAAPRKRTRGVQSPEARQKATAAAMPGRVRPSRNIASGEGTGTGPVPAPDWA
jgi:hypothetical protein